MKKINWFWAHRRNASLHHASFLMHGLKNKGWLPAVNFWFDNQIILNVPKKGTYIFYDQDQLKSGAKYKDIQDSIDFNPNFVVDFHQRLDELFGAVFFKGLAIEAENFSVLTNEELHVFYKDFLRNIMNGPIITVQLWGIEACFDEDYKIVKFLIKRLTDLGKSRDFDLYKGLLAVNTGETVAFTEQKNFYQVVLEMIKNENIFDLFKFNDVSTISKKLEDYLYENTLFKKHSEKYEWINTEYVSGGWSREKWIDLFKEAILNPVSPKEKLDEILKNFQDLNQNREKIIKELDPPADVLHSVNALAEFIAQRDWSKGYFTKALLSYRILLKEIARRIGIDEAQILYYTYIELDNYFKTGEKLSLDEIQNRIENGSVCVIKNGEFKITTGKDNIQKIIEEEGIAEPFEKLINISEFKGLGASRGLVKGKARVLEDASLISELKEGEILITYMTTIEFIPAFRKAAAVITDEGGMSCHAAIISREFNLPCVVGTKVATRVVQTGDEIEVDGGKGTVKILKSLI